MMERRRARRIALEVLYQMEVRSAPLDEILASRQVARQPLPEFSLQIVSGAVTHQGEIDSLIERYTEHWSIDRMPIIDRNIIRICIYEMMFEDIPIGVSINEAVELAKVYGTDDSSKFVNGLVARVAQELRERNREGARQ